MGMFNSEKKFVRVAGEYFGSHPAVPGHVKRMSFEMNERGVDIEIKRKIIKHFDWSEVTGFDNEDTATSTGNSRLTVTRMATLGVFSLAAPKKGQVSKKYVNVIHTTTGDMQLEHELPRTSSGAGSLVDTLLVRQSKHAKVYVANHAPATNSPSPGNQNVQGMEEVALQLEKLAALKQKGIITEEDFQAKKKQLLGL